MSLPSDILLELFGHREYRGSQQEIIERVLSGGHSLIIMPTGMGKSLCYQLPAVVLADRARSGEQQAEPPLRSVTAPLTLVISPLIALMKDQVDALLEKGVDATFINSSLQRSERVFTISTNCIGPLRVSLCDTGTIQKVRILGGCWEAERRAAGCR